MITDDQNMPCLSGMSSAVARNIPIATTFRASSMIFCGTPCQAKSCRTAELYRDSRYSTGLLIRARRQRVAKKTTPNAAAGTVTQ